MMCFSEGILLTFTWNPNDFLHSVGKITFISIDVCMYVCIVMVFDIVLGVYVAHFEQNVWSKHLWTFNDINSRQVVMLRYHYFDNFIRSANCAIET